MNDNYWPHRYLSPRLIKQLEEREKKLELMQPVFEAWIEIKGSNINEIYKRRARANMINMIIGIELYDQYRRQEEKDS